MLATSHMMTEVYGGTSRVMTEMHGATDRMMTEVGGGSQLYDVGMWSY